MSEDEAAALQAARDLVARRGVVGRHQVAAAAVTARGMHTGLNLESRMDRASICAEAAAIAQAALAEPGAEITFCAAVAMAGDVLPPCGPCRELLADFGPRARIAVPEQASVRVEPLSALLPHAYRSAERGLA